MWSDDAFFNIRLVGVTLGEAAGEGVSTEGSIGPPPGMERPVTPFERGAWLPMVDIFGSTPGRQCECHADDGREWEYIGNDLKVHGRYSSAQMVAAARAQAARVRPRPCLVRRTPQRPAGWRYRSNLATRLAKRPGGWRYTSNPP